MRIGAAPARDKIFNIARLAARVLFTATVKNARLRPKPATQSDERALLRDPDIGIGGVGEKEPVEALAQSRRLHILENRLQGGEHPARCLIVDRHDDGGFLAQRRGQDRRRTLVQQQDEADDGAAKAQRNPGEVQQEQRQQRPLQCGDAANVDDAIHLVAAIGGQREAAAIDDQPRQPGRAPKPRSRRGTHVMRVIFEETLRRHGQPVLGRGRRQGGVMGGGSGVRSVRVGQGVHL